MKSNNGLDLKLRNPATGKKRWTGPTSQALYRVYDEEYPPALFIEKARLLHHQLRLNGPPFDPWEIASRLKIAVREESMTIDGYVERRPDETFSICLRKEATVLRKRFTLCHEIAHTFFFDILEGSRRFRQKYQQDAEEERLCDIAAAEILMPFSSFNGYLTNAQTAGELDPTLILKLMDRYQASLQAVAARITSITNDVICALWGKKVSAINLKWATPYQARSLLLCQTGRTSVEEAIKFRGTNIAANDSFYVTGRTTCLIRRLTTSRSLWSGDVLSVLQPTRAGIAVRGNVSGQSPTQLKFRFK